MIRPPRNVRRGIAAAIAGIVVLCTGPAAAQVELVEQVRIQGGFIAEQRPAPAPRIENFHIGAIPEVALYSRTRRTQLQLSYSLSAALHSEYPNQLAHTGTLSGGFELTPRLRLVTSVFVSKTSTSTLLLNQPALASPTFFPTSTTTDIVTVGVNEGIGYDVTQDIRAEQHLTGTFFQALPPAPRLNSSAVVLSGSVERLWQYDAVGPEASIGFTTVRAAPPFSHQDYLVTSAGPHWRRDWDRDTNTLVAAGVSALISPDGTTRDLVAPFARGVVTYTLGVEAVIDATVSTSLTPNPLTGQATRAHQGTLHAGFPVRLPAQLYASVSLGYLRGTLLDPNGELGFDAVTSDAELTWRPTPLVDVFARYTYNGQIIEAPTGPILLGIPSFHRDSFLLGMSIRSAPPSIRRTRREGGALDERGVFSRRVDGADGVDIDDRPETIPNEVPAPGTTPAQPPPFGGRPPAPTGLPPRPGRDPSR